jgi:hypothetical protein
MAVAAMKSASRRDYQRGTKNPNLRPSADRRIERCLNFRSGAARYCDAHMTTFGYSMSKSRLHPVCRVRPLRNCQSLAAAGGGRRWRGRRMRQFSCRLWGKNRSSDDLRLCDCPVLKPDARGLVLCNRLGLPLANRPAEAQRRVELITCLLPQRLSCAGPRSTRERRSLQQTPLQPRR